MPIVKSTHVIDDLEIDMYIEVDEASNIHSPYEDLRDTNRVITSVSGLFSKGLALAQDCAAEVVNSIKHMGHEIRPTEYEIQLAIKLDSEVGAIITKATAGAQLQVTMKWVHNQDPPAR